MITNQVCQMVYLQANKSSLDQVWEGRENVGIFYGRLVYFIADWYILWSFGILYYSLVYFAVIWYIFNVLVSRSKKKNLATLITYKVHF
jgi:hypothetical protein